VNEGAGLIVLEGDIWITDIEDVARAHPDRRFVIPYLGNEVANVLYATTVDSEPSYLAGAAAAMRSTSGTIGYIAGVDWDGLWPFEAGYEAGAMAVHPGIKILKTYLSTGDDFSGFNDVDKARDAALQMYRQGADVIFHAAGDSGLGVFDAAAEFLDESGQQVWAIGVDTDQYETVRLLPGGTSLQVTRWQKHILTSVLKGFDTLIYTAVADYGQHKLDGGVWKWGLESGAMDISYSGGYLDYFRGDLEALKARIISGAITVPCIPHDKDEKAVELGIPPGACHPPVS
jgi:basic membrane protein A